MSRRRQLSLIGWFSLLALVGGLALPQAIALAAAAIDAHSVTSEHLASGDLTNGAEDGDFERTPASELPSSKSWPNYSGSAPFFSVVEDANCTNGKRCAKRSGSGSVQTSSLLNVARVDTRAGEGFVLTGQFKNVGADGAAGVLIRWQLKDGTTANSATVALPFNGTRTLTAAAPANAVSGRAVITVVSHSVGSWYADSIVLRRLSGSKEILDGSLTTSDLNLPSLDGRYPTRSSLTGGTPNSAGNPVSWGRLYNMPAGFADGVDNAAPDAIHSRQSGQMGICDTCVVTSVSLPMGVYWISAKVSVYDPELGGSERIAVNCQLTTGTAYNYQSYLDHAGADIQSSQAFVTLPLQDMHVSTGGPVRLICADTFGYAEATDAVITAIPVS